MTTMHRHSSNRNSPEPECSRYASPFRGLLSPKKSKESVSSSISRKIKSPFRSKAILSPSKSIKKALMQIRGPRSRLKASLPVIETENMESSEPSTPNVMEFLIDVCPEDVLPKILAFAGPQKTATLSKVNRVWRDVITEEWTWRVLCEDLYKWTPDQREPTSWKNYYMKNPVVPTDYPSIHKALAAVSNGSKKKPRQCGSVRILVRPGRYYMSEVVTVHATRRTTRIAVEAMKLPETCIYDENSFEYDLLEDRQVKLVSHTSLRNEPLFRVIRGKLVLKNMSLEHVSLGINIWSGNAAIQVQPDNAETTQPPPSSTVAKAALLLQSSEVVSHSGRGIVVLGGAHAQIKDSYIHDCAATGVYVGGDGSRAVLEAVDVTENGMGNQRVGGIVRGHSGIYIDQGIVSITDCNVSHNSSSGIAVISPDQTELTLKKTDILTNGNTPVDVHDGNAGRIVIHPDCQLTVTGPPHPARSTILLAELRADDESDAEIMMEF